jgi:pyruvate dehydrogenase E2 component (dihydrolipoamide acetyltransferase)
VPLDLKMPALSPTMEKGTLSKWLVGVGDFVRAGDLIAEIETDKATMEFEAVDDGTVSALLVSAGSENVAVGTVIAQLSQEGEQAAAAEAAMPLATTLESPVIAAPAKNAVPAPPVALTLEAGSPVNATPLARRIANALSIPLTEIRGTGARGKIVKSDLGLTPVPSPVAAPLAPAAESGTYPPPEGVPVESVKLSGMRKTIARRLSESKQTVPHFYLTSRCRLDALLRLRTELNEELAASGVKISVNDMVIKAMALAMVDVPDANVQFGGDVLHRFGRVDVSMAVAIAGGLVTPVIKGANSLSLSAIAETSKYLAGRARDGKLMPEEYQGGTASLSNLGMFGIDEMFPVINPPQALILGIGAGVEQPWKVDGALGLATVMAATASFDHRAIDGAVAAQFMAAFKERVERPLLLCC